jgi:hypothetical protein
MVCGVRQGFVRDCGVKNYFLLEGGRMTDFGKGFVTGAAASLVVCAVIVALVVFHFRDKELLEYAEKQIEIETLREDYGARDPYEFLDEVPGARGAVDNAADEFRRKRDEAVHRFRNRFAD